MFSPKFFISRFPSLSLFSNKIKDEKIEIFLRKKEKKIYRWYQDDTSWFMKLMFEFMFPKKLSLRGHQDLRLNRS